MAGKLHRLSAMAVAKASTPGARLSDGGNLYLRISKSGVKSWSFMYSTGGGNGSRGRQYELGLGPLHTVSLADARAKAADLRKMRIDGGDPIATRLGDRLAKNRTITFDAAAKTYIDAKRPEWANPKHADQWENTLRDYVSPIMGRYSVASIDTELVHKCLKDIWETKTETATRVRGRIEKILDWAATQRYRSRETMNPARWKGNLEHLLPAPAKLKNVEHFPALPYPEMGTFMADLRSREGVAARMVEMVIFTAARSNEVRGAVWGELDLDKAIWTIPAVRMKMRRDHRVPLSRDALAVLQAIKEKAGDVGPDALVFPNPKKQEFSDTAMTAVLKRMGRSDITVHGFRSTFRDWTAECTGYPRDVAEMALSHAIGDKVEAAYRRGELMDKRTRLMADWAAFCNTVQANTDNVVPLQGNSAA